MKPLKAISLDVGSKHVVGYFLNTEGQCRLTLMIADAFRDDASDYEEDEDAIIEIDAPDTLRGQGQLPPGGSPSGRGEV